jgi:hypothetical protein
LTTQVEDEVPSFNNLCTDIANIKFQINKIYEAFITNGIIDSPNSDSIDVDVDTEIYLADNQLIEELPKQQINKNTPSSTEKQQQQQQQYQYPLLTQSQALCKYAACLQLFPKEDFIPLYNNWILAFGKKIRRRTICGKFSTGFQWAEVLREVAQQKGIIARTLLPHYKSKSGPYFEVQNPQNILIIIL